MNPSPRVPPEICSIILEYLPAKVLAGLCCLSKDFRGIAESVLYRTVDVAAASSVLPLMIWCATVSKSTGQHLAREARVLRLVCPLLDGDIKRLHGALDLCVNLKQLHLDIYHDRTLLVDTPTLEFLASSSCPFRLTHFTMDALLSSNYFSSTGAKFWTSSFTSDLRALSIPRCSVHKFQVPDLSGLHRIVSLSLPARSLQWVLPAARKRQWLLESVQLFMAYNDVQELRFLAEYSNTLKTLSLIRDLTSTVPAADMMRAVAKWVPGIMALHITETGANKGRRREASLHPVMPLFPSLRELVLQFHRANAIDFEDPTPPPPAPPNNLRRSARNAAPPPLPPAPLKMDRPGERQIIGEVLMNAFPQLQRFELGVELRSKWQTSLFTRYPSGDGVECMEVQGRLWDAKQSFSDS
ncbi:hypothetical protein C8F01DRAFT_1130554, partial [Mycena amicta]